MGRALVPVQLQGIWLALDAGCVEEILGEQPWVRIPGAPASVPGVAPWRGRALAVLDLAALAGFGTAIQSGENRRRTLVVRSGSSTIAVPVDQVREVQEVGDDRIGAPRNTQLPYSTAEVELNGVPMPVLDWGALLAAVSQVAERPA